MHSVCSLAVVSLSFLVFLLYSKSGARFEKFHSDTTLPFVRVCLSPLRRLLPTCTGTLILPRSEEPKTCPLASDGGNSSVEVSSSQMTLVCVRLTKPTQDSELPLSYFHTFNIRQSLTVSVFESVNVGFEMWRIDMKVTSTLWV